MPFLSDLSARQWKARDTLLYFPNIGSISSTPATLLRNTLLLLFCFLLSGLGRVQGQPIKGMVWTLPATTQEAEVDLLHMHDMGVQAIRTGLIEDEALLTLADTLGLVFYQELPIRYLPAPVLVDSLDMARRVLTSALQRAQRHVSARHFGLAIHSDTSDPRACAYFADLAAEAQRAPGVQVYYIPLFIEADQCSGQVDFVLLNATESLSPYTLLSDWQRLHPGRPVGLAGVGTWTLGSRIVGIKRPHSLGAQARYLENHLPGLVADSSRAHAVFVDRWQDVATDDPITYQRRRYLTTYRTGLHDGSGTPRPVFDVVAGIYSGTRAVFAFPTGRAPLPSASWMILLGWGIVGVLAVGYAGLPRFQRMVVRYFTSHGFFRDAIRDAREFVLDINILVLVQQAIGAGLVGVFLLDALRMQSAFPVLMSWTPATVQGAIATLVVNPWVMILLVAGFYTLSIVVWAMILGVLSRQRYGGLAFPQVLTLVVWARWPFFLLMVAALVGTTLPAEQQGWWGLVLCIGWIGILSMSIFRTLADYGMIMRLPLVFTIFLMSTYPALWVGAGAAFFVLGARQEATFVWHILTLL